MNNSHLIYALAVLLCASLLFSCVPDLEVPPPPNEQISSSGTEQPPLSQSNDNPSSSSTQAPPTSSPAQSSSSLAKSSSSSAQIIVGSPDYLIECYDWDESSCNKIVYLNARECVEINILNNTNSYNGELSMACEADGGGNIAFTLTLNGKSVSTTSNYYAQAYISIGQLKKGNNQFGTLCLTALSGSITNTVECSGPYSIDD